ncbi:MAG: 50S ribosomal protein L23 [Deltaproteobacteria bacterium]|nr:50S ribosomal protein L23 [Deltaproteobacteria bacterium]MBI4926071.1 50S ribosomal protein L23 [Bdellovibrio sp.]
MQSQYDVILRPLISEKSTALAELANKYVFQVANGANKNEIRDTVQRLFNVRVKKVHTLVVHGKVKRYGKTVKKESNWKKAVVTLMAGSKIEIFQNK